MRFAVSPRTAAVFVVVCLALRDSRPQRKYQLRPFQRLRFPAPVVNGVS